MNKLRTLTVSLDVPGWVEPFINGFVETNKESLNVLQREVSNDAGQECVQLTEIIECKNGDDVEKLKRSGGMVWLMGALFRLGVPCRCSVVAIKEQQYILNWMEALNVAGGPWYRKTHVPINANADDSLVGLNWSRYIEAGNSSSWFGFRSVVSFTVEPYEGWSNLEALNGLGRGIGLASRIAKEQLWTALDSRELIGSLRKEIANVYVIKDGMGSNLGQWMLAHCMPVKTSEWTDLLVRMKDAGVDFNKANKIGNNILHSTAFNANSEEQLDQTFQWAKENGIDWNIKNKKGCDAINMVNYNSNQGKEWALWHTPLNELIKKYEAWYLKKEFTDLEKSVVRSNLAL